MKCYAPNDPGYPEYVAAFEAILRRGEVALSREFAVTETIALTRWTHAPAAVDPTRFRWFRILTCAAEILIDQSEWPHYGLAALLVDSFALEEAGDDYNQLHPVWLDLVATRFPVAPPAAAAMKQRLLTDGARWRHTRRVLS